MDLNNYLQNQDDLINYQQEITDNEVDQNILKNKKQIPIEQLIPVIGKDTFS